MSPLVSARTIAQDVLGVASPTTVLRLAADGTIPAIRVSERLIRFDPDAVRKALKKMETAATK